MPARSIEQIRNLCKRRGFIFPGSAAYGGLGSFWDYGPLGVEMLHHIKRAWWRATVYERDDMEGLDGAIITSRKVWQHSGHEATFGDVLVEDRATNSRLRLDHLLEAQADSVIRELSHTVRDVVKFATGQVVQRSIAEPGAGPVTIHSGLIARATQAGQKGAELEKMWEHCAKLGQHEHAAGWRGRLVRHIWDVLLCVNSAGWLLTQAGVVVQGAQAAADGTPQASVDGVSSATVDGVSSATVGGVSRARADWTTPRQFSGMFKTHIGAAQATTDEEELASRVYLRPETAQTIFMNFKHVQNSLRRKVPFGVAQIGKAFRNEITPGNFIFRTREFEQMEIEFFIKPPQFVKDGEKTDEQWHEEWISQRYNWWLGLGVDPSRLRKRAQDKAELAHYAKATTDLEYLFPDFGWGEVEGVANRTDFDLSAHSRDVPDADLARLKLEKNADSTETFDYFDPEAKARYIPWVIEPSAGVTRAMLTFLCEAYHEELVKEPTQAEVDPLKVEIDAAIKNAQKKAKEAEKETDPAQRKHDPAAIAAFTAALTEMAARLPASLLEIDNLLEEHPGAANLEPVKKLKPKVNKLAEDCVRVVLRLHPTLAPVKVAIFPLKRNAPEIVDIAHRITKQLSPFMRVQYDDSAGIGRLYRRQDEIGTPFCITVDFDTLEDNTVTLRERDSMQQSRVKIDELKHLLMQRLQLA